MSCLHYELVDKYKKYKIISADVYLKKYNYLFNVIADSKIIIGGTHIILATYDAKRNIFIWADNSNVLDRVILEEIRNIRYKLLESVKSNNVKSNNIFKYAKKNIVIMTTNEVMKLLSNISDVLQIDIIININNYLHHIHIIKKILSDNR
jgi:hypothetical protein